MKTIKNVKNTVNKNLITLIAALIISVIVLAFGVFAVKPQSTAQAETAGSVTVHVYDPAQKYNTLGAWMWVGSGAGVEVKISSSAAANEQFYKEYSVDGAAVKNVARTFTLDLTAAQVTTLKGSGELGILICVSTGTATGDFWKRYEKETEDVYVSIAGAFDANNHADVYLVRKDVEAYTDIQEALKTLDKITSARFTAKTANSATVTFDTTTPISKTAKATLYIGDKAVGQANVSVNATTSTLGTCVFSGVAVDMGADYTLKVDGISAGCAVIKTGFIDDVDFIKTYEGQDTQNQELGAVYTKESTVFRVWAPFASAAALNIYSNGSSGSVLKTYEMKKQIPQSGTWGGVWEYLLNGDQHGKYYTYSITNGASVTETIDPYAKACGENGKRGMVVDLSRTNPTGWAEDAKWHLSNAVAVDTPIVWEVQVNDFSSSADSGMKYKGKYLAFTEKNTTVPGTSLPTGVNYLKDLGITYVHLNPVYDFATVDESDMTRADGNAYNWGYDPQNYNIPEGSYSTDPANGTTRIYEFKRMVQALHEAGIGVIMDVVYNHTFSTGGQALHDTVPYYYHRTDANGKFTNGAGCGNETASERTMVRKYIVESILYWAKEYHIDGFRFDLMGLHDNTTITTIRNKLDALQLDDGSNGRRILMYGEPWSADGSYKPASYTKRMSVSKTGVTGYALNPATNKLIKNYFAGENDDYPRDMTALPNRVAIFNDTGREGLRGSNDPGQGWANGNIGAVGGVMRMLEGGAGGSGSGMVLGAGSRNIAYAERTTTTRFGIRFAD